MGDDTSGTFRLDGKISVVTGASRGIGQVLAVALAKAGAYVAAVARNDDGLQETTTEIRSHGGRAIAVRCDLRSSDSVDAMVVRVLEEFGQIDVLVNNAGGGDMKPLLKMSEKEWLAIIELNVNGIFRTCKAVGPHMISRRQGRIINMSSMYGLIGEKYVTAYCASKGAIIQFTKALALEWAEFGITVNALAPGYIYTKRTSSVFDDPEYGPGLISRIPIGRFGQPEELGPLVIYLASDASALMTGSVIVIDGGQTAA